MLILVDAELIRWRWGVCRRGGGSGKIKLHWMKEGKSRLRTKWAALQDVGVGWRHIVKGGRIDGGIVGNGGGGGICPPSERTWSSVSLRHRLPNLHPLIMKEDTDIHGIKNQACKRERWCDFLSACPTFLCSLPIKNFFLFLHLTFKSKWNVWIFSLCLRCFRIISLLHSPFFFHLRVSVLWQPLSHWLISCIVIHTLSPVPCFLILSPTIPP